MDHERVNITLSTMSCGVMELSRISDETEAVLYAIASRLYHPSRGSPAAFIVWSDIPKKSEGTSTTHVLELAIRLQLLGGVQVSTFSENPKTGNIIAIWTWCVNHKAFKEWYAKQRVKKLGTVGALR